MAGEAGAGTIHELVDWLEDQLRHLRAAQVENGLQVDQLRRQIAGIAELVQENDRKVRDVDPKLLPLKGLPDKIRNIEEDAEHIRQAIEANHRDAEGAARLLQAESEYTRQEVGEVIRRVGQASDQLAVIAADVAQSQQAVGQVSQLMQTVQERQREVEALVEQFSLRLERHIEVQRELVEQLRDEWKTYEDERISLVFERLQVVGEMVKRNEELIASVTQEQTIRDEVMQEVGVWRDQHNRLDVRLAALEESAEGVTSALDRLRGQVTLIEGRHSGLGERVAGMRREIAEVVDGVRAEFAKYNQMTEKQRRKQIQVLEQELREMKFHAFRPPEEP